MLKTIWPQLQLYISTGFFFVLTYVHFHWLDQEKHPEQESLCSYENSPHMYFVAGDGILSVMCFKDIKHYNSYDSNI